MTDTSAADERDEIERNMRARYPAINARGDRIMALTGLSSQARWISCPDPDGRPRVNAIAVDVGVGVALLETYETDISNKRIAAAIKREVANMIVFAKTLNRTTEH